MTRLRPDLYDEITPGYYDEVYARRRGLQWFWHEHRFRAVAEWMPPAGDRILDLGCGPGTFLGHFAGGYRHAIGIDVARPQIEFAERRYGSDRMIFETKDVADLTHGEPFDTIVSIEVIEHLPVNETASFLRTIFRLLKSGGTLVLTTPNYRSFWPVIECFISKRGPVNYLEQHINRFHLKRLVSELGNAGFVVRSKRTFFVIAPFLAPISSRLAEIVYSLERRLLPRLGSEIVVRATRP